MPVNAIFGNIGTILYIVVVVGVAAGLIGGEVIPAFDSAGSVSSGTIALGIQEQVDGLRPGMSVSLTLLSMTGVSESVVLSGHDVTATVDGQSTTMAVNPAFKDTYTLTATAQDLYLCTYEDGEVVITT